MSMNKTCDLCRGMQVAGPGESAKVTTYSLRRYMPKSATRNYISAGSIDICDRCWSSKCRPRMVPARGLRKSKEQTVAG